MKICIAGGRDFDKFSVLEDIMNELLSDIPEPVTIISGHAAGADSMGELYARLYGLATEVFPAEWQRHGRTTAGFKRNAIMAGQADMLVAFWDGQSKGTAHMIRTMRNLGKPCLVFNYIGEPRTEDDLTPEQRRQLQQGMSALRAKLEEKKKADIQRQSTRPQQPSPRYDDVYFSGLEWLDSL